jgi:hypothetical protein
VTVLHIVLALGFAWSMGAAMAGAGFARARESVRLAIAFAVERIAHAMTG